MGETEMSGWNAGEKGIIGGEKDTGTEFSLK